MSVAAEEEVGVPASDGGDMDDLFGGLEVEAIVEAAAVPGGAGEEEADAVLPTKVVEYEPPPKDESIWYANLPATLAIETRPFTEARFAQHPDDHPWRVIRWRTARAADGSTYPESNARLVTWEDGTQHVFIGNRTAYAVTREKLRRGANDLMNVSHDAETGGGVWSHFAPLEERVVFRLEKEPAELKSGVPDKKARKVKVVSGVSTAQDEAVAAEEDARRRKSQLEKQRERKQRQTTSAALTRSFLEEGVGGAAPDEYDRNDGFIDDDGGAGGGEKRGRGEVEEDRLLRAKRAQPAPKPRKELDDGVDLYDDDDDGDLEGFIDDDEEEDGAKGVVISEDSDD